MPPRSLAVLTALALSTIVPSLRPQQPIEGWIEQLADPERAADAQLALLRAGAPAAAALGEALATDAWQEKSHGGTARAAAARLLQELGPQGVPAFAVLVDCVTDRQADAVGVQLAAGVLEWIGPFAGEARADFVAMLEANSSPSAARQVVHPAFRRWWGRVVSSLSLDGSAAPLDELLAAIDGPDPFARVTACRALAARRDEFDDRERERIAAALRDAVLRPEEPIFTWRAAGSTPMQMRFSATDVRWLRTAASLALLAHAPQGPECLLGWSEHLYGLDPALRIAAARQLGALRHPDAGPWLVGAVPGAPDEVAIAMLEAIERIGPGLEHLGPALCELEQSPSKPVAGAARRVRRAVAPGPAAAPVRSEFEIVGVGSHRRLVAETRRLLLWLDGDGGRNRLRLHQDPRHIEQYHRAEPDDGRPAVVRWVPVRVTPDELRPGKWCELEAGAELGVVSAAPPGACGRDRERLAPLPWIVELLPADRRDPSFGVEDLATLRTNGTNTWVFGIEPRRQGDYQTLAADLIARGGGLAFVVDGLAVAVQDAAIRDPRISAGGFELLPGAADRHAALVAMSW